MADAEADWFAGGDDDSSNNVADEPSGGDAPADAAPSADTKYRPIIPSGPPVPNPYAHCVSEHLFDFSSLTTLFVFMCVFFFHTYAVKSADRRSQV